MNYLKLIRFSVLILFILFISIAAFFLNTTPGLYLAVKVANRYLPGKIQLEKLQGRLIDGAAFTTLTYVDNEVRIELHNAHIHWKIASLSQLSIKQLQADKLIIHIKNTPQTAHIGAALMNIPLNLQIKDLQIATVTVNKAHWTEQFHHVHLQADFNTAQWTITRLDTDAAKLHMTLSAHAKPTAPFNLEGALTFAPITSSTNALRGQIQFSGNVERYHWHGQFTGFAQGTLHGALTGGHHLSTTIRWHDLHWMYNTNTVITSTTGQLAIHGTPSDVLLDLQTHFSAPVSAQWHANARITNNQLNATSVLHTPQGDLNATLHYAKQQLNATLSQGKNTITVKGKTPFSWQARASLPQPELLHPALAGLQTTLLAKATLASAQEGKLAISISPGSYHIKGEHQAIAPIHFEGGDLIIDLSPQSLKAHGKLTIDNQKTLALSLRLPAFQIDKMPSSTQTVDASLHLHINTLDFLHALSTAIEKPQGQVHLSLIAQGLLAAPIIKGELQLTDASVFLPQFNLMLNAIKATLSSENKQWKTIGSITSEGHTLDVTGEGVFSPAMTGNITLSGDNFPLMNTAEYTFNISPKLTLALTSQGLALRGVIVIPTALIKPVSLSSSVDLSDDAIFINDTPAHPIPLNMHTDLEIQMGKDVALDVSGLHGFLDGTLHIKQLPHHEPYAIGELTIRDGKFNAYGQDLQIQQGLLQFTGGLMNNPAIRLRAVRQFNNATANFSGSNQLFDFNPENTQTLDFGNKTTVGIEVSGRLNSTKIKLFSIPPTLSQADILSMIILGRPASQASKSGGQLLLTALSSMNLDTGTKGLQLIDQLKESIGFDINVQNAQGFNQKTNQVTDNTQLVVGKSLSKRLYLSYNVDVFQRDSNMLTLKYILNKFFSIQVTASDAGNGIDLLYTHSKDQHD